MWADCLLCTPDWGYKQNWCSASVHLCGFENDFFTFWHKITVQRHLKRPSHWLFSWEPLMSPWWRHKLKLQCLSQQGWHKLCFSAAAEGIWVAWQPRSSPIKSFHQLALGFATGFVLIAQRTKPSTTHQSSSCRERLRPWKSKRKRRQPLYLG